MLSSDKIIDELRHLLLKPLPGQQAQLLMAPAGRTASLNEKGAHCSATRSSVLILLYPEKNRLMTTFILRPQYDGIHSGQISLPGGRFENYDVSLKQTALRETDEEIGVCVPTEQILGKLTPLYIPPSNFIVHPYIGYINSKPSFNPDKIEVKKIIEADITLFFDQKNIGSRLFSNKRYKIKAPFFNIDNYHIWGATAMIMSEFCMIIKSSNLLSSALISKKASSPPQ